MKIDLSNIERDAAKIKLKKSSMTYETAPDWIKKKIDNGRRLIAIAGLPKRKK